MKKPQNGRRQNGHHSIVAAMPGWYVRFYIAAQKADGVAGHAAYMSREPIIAWHIELLDETRDGQIFAHYQRFADPVCLECVRSAHSVIEQPNGRLYAHDGPEFDNDDAALAWFQGEHHEPPHHQAV